MKFRPTGFLTIEGSYSDVRQSLQTERTQIQAAGNTTLYGQQAVQIDAADVRAGGNARVSSQGSVVLGSNTDTEQRNWTTSSVDADPILTTCAD